MASYEDWIDLMAKSYRGAVPIHPVMTTAEELLALPDSSIVSVTGHDEVLFVFRAGRGVFTSLSEDLSNMEASELLASYYPVRLVWLP